MLLLTGHWTVRNLLAATALLQLDLLDITHGTHHRRRIFKCWMNNAYWESMIHGSGYFFRNCIAKPISVVTIQRRDEGGHPGIVFVAGKILRLPSAASHSSRINAESVAKDIQFFCRRKVNRAHLARNSLRHDAMKIRIVYFRVQFPIRNQLPCELMIQHRHQEERRSWRREAHWGLDL